MNADQVAEIYQEIRKDIVVGLQYRYGCSPEDAEDAVQRAVVALLSSELRYKHLNTDQVEARLRKLTFREMTNIHTENTRRQILEDRYLHATHPDELSSARFGDMGAGNEEYIFLPGGGRMRKRHLPKDTEM